MEGFIGSRAREHWPERLLRVEAKLCWCLCRCYVLRGRSSGRVGWMGGSGRKHSGMGVQWVADGGAEIGMWRMEGWVSAVGVK